MVEDVAVMVEAAPAAAGGGGGAGDCLGPTVVERSLFTAQHISH